MHIIITLFYVVNFAFARSVNTTTEIRLTTTSPTRTTPFITPGKPLSRYEQGLEDYDEALENMRGREGRGMMEMDFEHDHGHDHNHDNSMKEMAEQKAVKTDPWAGYYDFIINEGSFKFWAAFQLGTALLLIYSAFAAVYYAKFNPITTDYDYYDDFFFRSNGRSASSSSSSSWLGLDAQTFQRIINAIATNKYS